MERMLREKQESDQLRHEQLISTLSQSVSTLSQSVSQTVSGKLDKVMKTEMKQSVVPGILYVYRCVCLSVCLCVYLCLYLCVHV